MNIIINLLIEFLQSIRNEYCYHHFVKVLVCSKHTTIKIELCSLDLHQLFSLLVKNQVLLTVGNSSK